MSDITVLIIAVVGGLAGITVVGIAFWMMRQEDTAKPKEASAETDTVSVSGDVVSPAGDSTPSSAETASATPAISEATDSPTAEAGSNWMAQLREAPPPPVVEEPATPTEPASLPPLEIPRPAPSAPANTGWFGTLASRVAPSAATVATPVAQELLRLLRTSEGDLIVEVYGRRYRTRAEITDAPVEQQVSNASADLTRFLAEASEGIKAVAPTALAPLPPITKKESVDTRPVVKVSLQEAAQMELKPPTMDIMTQFRYVRDQQKKPVVQIKSVMDEIDEILQVMVIGTPLAPRGLKASDGTHGAVFTLDGKNYDSVDALPDPEAREMLRSAIQKWDQK